MQEPMTPIILLTVLLGTAATIILLIYLIDRINRLERLTFSDARPAAEQNAESAADNSFLGLSGQLLWDAMAGKSPEGFNENDLITLKPRYERLLQTHIERIFDEGVKDARQGAKAKRPRIPLEIKTLRGSVNSWMPPQHASAIYNAGFQSVNAAEPELSVIRDGLDNAANLLYSRTNLELHTPFSSALLPSPEPVEETLLEDLPAPPDEPAANDNSSK